MATVLLVQIKPDTTASAALPKDQQSVWSWEIASFNQLEAQYQNIIEDQNIARLSNQRRMPKMQSLSRPTYSRWRLQTKGQVLKGSKAEIWHMKCEMGTPYLVLQLLLVSEQNLYAEGYFRSLKKLKNYS